jgi:hypothetical protein
MACSNVKSFKKLSSSTDQRATPAKFISFTYCACKFNLFSERGHIKDKKYLSFGSGGVVVRNPLIALVGIRRLGYFITHSGPALDVQGDLKTFFLYFVSGK